MYRAIVYSFIFFVFLVTFAQCSLESGTSPESAVDGADRERRFLSFTDVRSLQTVRPKHLNNQCISNRPRVICPFFATFGFRTPFTTLDAVSCSIFMVLNDSAN